MALKKGTRGNNTLNGTAGVDYLFGYLGDDTLNGLAGNDRIYGGGGKDKIDGGAGNDVLYGGEGADKIRGGAGDDTIYTNGGLLGGFSNGDNSIDIVDAGAGNDVVNLDVKDVALGGQGKDVLTIFAVDQLANDVLMTLDFSKIGSATASAIGKGVFATTKVGQFESVNFSAFSAKSNSSIIGSSGDDSFQIDTAFVSGVTAGVAIAGGAGNDTISGSRLDDNLKGGTGDDRLDGDSGHDKLNGGAGVDVFEFHISFVLSPDNSDIIADFSTKDDVIAILANKSTMNFGDESNLLQKGNNLVNGTTAAGVAQMLYNTATGALSVDNNGSTSGGVTLLATLSNKANISSADISIEYFNVLV